MIQFNLLPDVKLNYIKAERTKRMVISIATLASIVALAILVILFLVVNVAQKSHLSDLNTDIKTSTKKLQDTPNLNQILTIQSQLSSLTTLHDAKPLSSRVYGYLGQVTPSNVTVSSVGLDFATPTITITGNGEALDDVNTFVDTLKFTKYTTDKVSEPKNAFSNVVLTTFGRAKDAASYSITLQYDPEIFKATNEIELTVPKTITTRSVTELPTNLFKAAGE